MPLNGKPSFPLPSAGTADEGTGSCPVKMEIAERSGAGADKERVPGGLEAERAEILAQAEEEAEGVNNRAEQLRRELQGFRQIINVILDFDPENGVQTDPWKVQEYRMTELEFELEFKKRKLQKRKQRRMELLIIGAHLGVVLVLLYWMFGIGMVHGRSMRPAYRRETVSVPETALSGAGLWRCGGHPQAGPGTGHSKAHCRKAGRCD